MSKPVLLEMPHIVSAVAQRQSNAKPSIQIFFSRTDGLSDIGRLAVSFLGYDGIIALDGCSIKAHALCTYILEKYDTPVIHDYWKNRVVRAIFTPSFIHQALRLNELRHFPTREYLVSENDLVEEIEKFKKDVIVATKNKWCSAERPSMPTVLFRRLLPQVRTKECQSYLRDLFSLRDNFRGFNRALTLHNQNLIAISLEKEGLSFDAIPVENIVFGATPIRPDFILQLLQAREVRLLSSVAIAPIDSTISPSASSWEVLRKAGQAFKAKFAKPAPSTSIDPGIQDDISKVTENACPQLKKDAEFIRKMIKRTPLILSSYDVFRCEEIRTRCLVFIELTTYALPQMQPLIHAIKREIKIVMGLNKEFQILRKSFQEALLAAAALPAAPVTVGQSALSKTAQSLSLEQTPE